MVKLTLPSGVDEFHRININEDKNWETDFVPWLETLEKDGVGVEDGFFVATFSDAIRNVNNENEGNFVKSCAGGLQSVAIQRFKQFDQALTMHYGVHSLINENHLQRFKDETADIREYTKETCCSGILRENGLQALMDHLDSFIHSKKTKSHSVSSRGWFSSSRVVTEEIGEQVKKNYSKYQERSKDFGWNSKKPDLPIKCEEAQCALMSDSQESTDDDDYKVQQKNMKRNKVISQTEPAYNDLLLYGFGHSDCDEFKDLKVTEKFQMTRLFNLLWLLPHMVPGFHSSYYFYGTGHSTFPIHVEDALTFSGNVLYVGQAKLWVMIPPWATSLLEYHLKKCGSFLAYMHCSNLLGHKSLVPTIQGLLDFNIPFKIVVQHPGDMVILYPNTAHYGFNLGRNFAEAINFALPSWVPWGAMANKCSCLIKQLHIPIKPFIVAFRPDLLDDLEHGIAITTPFFVRGIQLLATEIEKIARANQNYRSKMTGRGAGNLKYWSKLIRRSIGRRFRMFLGHPKTLELAFYPVVHQRSAQKKIW